MSVRRWFWLLCVTFILLSPVAMAADSTAVTVETSLGAMGTASELILCPLVDKPIVDLNWLYRALPGSAPITTAVIWSPVIPPTPIVTDLSQTWPQWNAPQNLVVDPTDTMVSMEEVLFDTVASTTASGPVMFYVYSEKACSILRATEKAYREYLAGKGIAYTEIEKSTVPNFNTWVSQLNYLSPKNFTVPLLLINGDPVVGRMTANTKARIDKLLKKHGMIP